MLSSDFSFRFKEVRLRNGERPVSTQPRVYIILNPLLQAYNQLCQHHDIRFGLKRVETPYDKVFILLQVN
jgi:DNA-binding winged helix-turn-helix (wHTH) protein